MKKMFLLLLLTLFTIPGSRVPAFSADHSKPSVTDTYTNVLSYIDARLDDIAVQFQGITPTNIPTNTVRFNPSTYKREKWNGSAWVDLAATYAENVHTVDGFHASQTPGANQAIVLDGNGNLLLRGSNQVYLPNNKWIRGRNASNDGEVNMISVGGDDVLYLGTDSPKTYSGYQIWHGGNDGAGSGLAADTAETAASSTNSANLNNHPGSYYQDAGNLNAGILPDARLSNNVPLKGSSGHINQRVSQVYSGLNASGITISGLDGDTDGVWDIYIRAKLTTATDQWLRMEINGDATDANYYYGHYITAGTAARPAIGAVRGDHLAVFHIRIYAKTGDWRPFMFNAWTPGSAYYMIYGAGEWRNTSSNISSLRFYADASAVIADGATVTVVRAP